MIPESHWRVLGRLCARLEPEGIAWAVTGSAGLALQGVPCDVHDLDIQGDEASVYAIERCFAGEVRQPVHWRQSEAIASHFGILELDGVKVELMGGLQKRLPAGGWEAPVPVGKLRRFVEARGLRIPVLPLEHEYEAYRLMGRTAKAELIKRTIDTQHSRGQ
jgi:hypothetical protein